MQTIVVVLDSEKLENPDLDIRYELTIEKLYIIFLLLVHPNIKYIKTKNVDH